MRLVVTTDGFIKEWGTSRRVGNTYLEGRYTASAGYIQSTGVCHTDPDCALSARVSRGSCAFSLPRGGKGYGKTFGLMGALSGDRSKEGNFRNFDGSYSTIKSSQRDNDFYDFGLNGRGRTQSRTNGPRVQQWSRTFMVGISGNPAIDLGFTPAQAQAYWASAAFKVKLVELEAAEAAYQERKKAGKPAKKWTFPMAKSFPLHKVEKTPAKVAFCKKLLKGIKKNRKQHMKSCIMDGDFPEQAKRIVQTIKRVAKQKKVVKKLLKKQVRKQQRLAVACGLGRRSRGKKAGKRRGAKKVAKQAASVVVARKRSWR